MPSRSYIAFPQGGPLVPSLSAALNGNTEIDLTMTYPGAVTSYSLYYATSPGGPFSLLATQSSPLFAHKGLSADTTYYYQMQVATPGWGQSPVSSVVSQTTPQSSTFNPSYPRKAVYGIGGDQTYGFSTYGTFGAANLVTQTLARFDMVIMSGSYEGWNSGGTMNKNTMVTSVKSGNGNGRAVASAGTLVFLYCIVEEAKYSGSGTDPSATYTAFLNEFNWWVYEAGPTGSVYSINLTPGTGPGTEPTNGSNYAETAFEVDYTNGEYFAGAQSNGDGASEVAAAYAFYSLMSTDRSGTGAHWYSSFANLQVDDAAPDADGIFWDNLLRCVSCGGGVAELDMNRAGVASAQGYSEPSADWRSAGHYRRYACQQTLAPTKYNNGNAGDYARSTEAGVAPYSMQGILHAALFEVAFGSVNSPDSDGPTSDFVSQVLQLLSITQSPNLVFLSCDWINAGSQPSISNGVLPNEIYQMLRYALAFACIYSCLLNFDQQAESDDPGYSVSPYTDIQWFDEYDNGNVVNSYTNLANGWLGQPFVGTGYDGTTTTGQQGGKVLANGMYAREFVGGLVLWNPPWNGPGGSKGTGTTTLSPATIGGSGKWKRIQYTYDSGSNPTVNNGTTVTSTITLGTSASARDGLFLVRV